MPRSPFFKSRLTLRLWQIVVTARLLESKGRLCTILCQSRMETTRLIIALGSLTWAALLLKGSILFEDWNHTYVVMAAMLPEDSWGFLFLISGLVGLWSLLTDNRNRWTLALDAMLGAALWTASTLACFAAHWPMQVSGLLNQLAAYSAPAAMSGELWLSIFAWWCLVRHVIDSSATPPRTRREDKKCQP